MKDIKITKENYKELFECAGFEEVEVGKHNAFCLDKHCGGNFLFLVFENEEVTAWFSTDPSVLPLSLNPTNNSTAEIDRLFYPFLDKPLVWQKKWDFESVFNRVWGGSGEAVKQKMLSDLYVHSNPRVQAFSGLLFVMEELNKEYEGTEQSLCEVHIREGWISVDYFSSRADIVGVWVLNSSDAADLFLRDNEQDLKTFFNI